MSPGPIPAAYQEHPAVAGRLPLASGRLVHVRMEPGPGDLDGGELVDHETLGRPVALELFHDPARGGLTGQDAASEGARGCLPVEAVRLIPLRVGDLEIEH